MVALDMSLFLNVHAVDDEQVSALRAVCRTASASTYSEDAARLGCLHGRR